MIETQAADMGADAAFAVLALVSFFRKSKPVKEAPLIAAVAYLGLYTGPLSAIVNVYGLITLNLPVFQFSLAWYMFAGFTLVSTELWGRLYCSRVCAFGAMTQLLDYVVPARMRFDVPLWLEVRATRVKYGILAATLLYFLVTRDISAYRYVEPFWMFTFQGSNMASWVGLALLLVATVAVRNLYCRFLCPLGAFLGLLSNLTVFRIK